MQQPSTSTHDRLETTTKVSGSVIAKLLLFTIAMVVLPIGTYFTTVDRVFGGNGAYAAGAAAGMANVVAIAYVIVAAIEGQQQQDKDKKSD
ncbi:predicted protein [Lichtheimia corymbifera JMRC:FSU:9682]|uniref:Uncharacterized protein n=2 Tax=Lichtheimia TaxID=688353 RepID=A0A068RL72_9FUNG|nr:uncharacterized protein O0I10_001205 [Lichtheimia ornata]KAJ8663028.1 hypothetical protein O0I10_001205 [Lichtheimia ornata]CDH50455.1 predicted protein [Lichtheimia corymbifera JMRC:FSU:9682]